MRKLRILQTNNHRGGWGGQPNRILIKSKGLIDRGHFVIIAAPRNSTLVQRAKVKGVPTYDDLEFSRKFSLFNKINEVRKIRNLIEVNEIDIVHTHGSQDTWIAATAAIFSHRKPVVIRTRHNTFPISAHFFNRLLYRKMIDRVIAVSSGVVKIFEENKLVPYNSIKIISSSVEMERFLSVDNGAEIRKEFGIGMDTLLIGMVGRFAREKGHEVLLSAAKAVVSKRPDAKFILAGEGPEEENIKKKAIQMNIGKSVVFAGFRTDIPKFLAALDIFVLTPVAGESLGTAILEAFAMKKPVVASDLGGINTSVRHGKTGFLFKPGDSEELAEKLVELIEDSSLRKRFGEAGRKMIEEEFTKERMVALTEELYFEELEKRETKIVR